MEKYGEANPFDTMMGHITNMSKEIAQMEILGPNPSATLEYLKLKIRKDKKSSDSAPYDLQDIVVTGYVQAADTVEIRVQNESGSTVDLASGTWKLLVLHRR